MDVHSQAVAPLRHCDPASASLLVHPSVWPRPVILHEGRGLGGRAVLFPGDIGQCLEKLCLSHCGEGGVGTRMLLNSPGHGQPGSLQCCPRLFGPFQSCSAAQSAGFLSTGFLGIRFLSRWDQAALGEGRRMPLRALGTESLVRKDGPFPGLTQALGWVQGKPGSA